MKKGTIVLKSTTDECNVYCDGEFLTELRGQVQVMKVKPGEHLFEFKKQTKECGELSEDVIVDLPEGGRKVIYEGRIQYSYECEKHKRENQNLDNLLNSIP